MDKAKEFIGRIESELLLLLLDYAIPFLNEKIKPVQKERPEKQGGLENMLKKKPKIQLEGIKELEALLFNNVSENVKISKSKSVNAGNVAYSLGLRREIDNAKSDYSVSIRYEENQKEERLKISIKNNDKEVYSAEIINKKDAKDSIVPYSIKISYESSYAEERLNISYSRQLKSYIKKHIEGKEDMSSMVPLKWLNILPETMMGGVLGFTYIGDPSMGRRADLTGKTARMVDIHESIHTPDEYETRVLTSWIMEKAKIKYNC